MATLSLDAIQACIDSGTVRARNHPTLPLTIYNYTERCQYDRLWNETSLQCRGLVLHGSIVVARPLQKFFNDTEQWAIDSLGPLPWDKPHDITEKLDGSLLIVFYFKDRWITATRGSFTSGQAIEGLRILQANNVLSYLDTSVTYLFEVIFPANRIVIDYGNRRDAVLLAMIHTHSGIELPRSKAPNGVSLVRRLNECASFEQLKSLISDAEEGYVVRFQDGIRVKVKGERYILLHRIISGVSTVSVWESLRDSVPLDEHINMIPSEVRAWVIDYRQQLKDEFNARVRETQEAVMAVSNLETRKEQAAAAIKKWPAVANAVFAALDRKPFEPIIWKQLRPEFRRPGSTGDESE